MKDYLVLHNYVNGNICSVIIKEECIISVFTEILIDSGQTQTCVVDNVGIYHYVVESIEDIKQMLEIYE